MSWILLAFAFFLGSIPFGLIISRYWLGIDIRQQGSGNIGMTNVMRVGGKLPGALTFALDFFKGTAAVLLAQAWLSPELEPVDREFWVALIAVTAVCGHVFSVFLNFKGGKGVSTLFGVLAAVHLPTGLAAAAVWGGMFLWKRISSLSALTMLATLPFWLAVAPLRFGDEVFESRMWLFSGLAALLIYKHRSNITRLLSGEEGQLRASATSNSSDSLNPPAPGKE